MPRNAEQRISLKFMAKRDLSLIESWRILKEVFKDSTMGKTKCDSGTKRFKFGDESTFNRPRSGRLKTRRTEESISLICELLEDDSQSNLSHLVQKTGLSKLVIVHILSRRL